MGGIFFDDLAGTPQQAEGALDAEAFTRDVGEGILASWLPIVQVRAAAVRACLGRAVGLLAGECGAPVAVGVQAGRRKERQCASSLCDVARALASHPLTGPPTHPNQPEGARLAAHQAREVPR